ncbi:polysaccharide pyruvyl transferase family protein [Pseudoroseomonas wenyumeiae]
MISKINIPIILMSAGIQDASSFGSSYPAQFKSFLDVLKDKNCHVFTRGDITADFLRRQGLSRVEPTGCPSLFAYPGKVVESLRRLKEIDWRKPLEIVHAGYLGSVADAVVDINALGVHTLLRPMCFRTKQSCSISTSTAPNMTLPMTRPTAGSWRRSVTVARST